MVAAIAYLLVGGVAFWGQDVDGIRVGPVKPLTGQAGVNYRQDDIDGDGAVDLLFSSGAALQREGGFPPQARVYLPQFDGLPIVDVMDGKLYFRLPDRLAVYGWEGQWTPFLDQSLEWPAADDLLTWMRMPSAEKRGAVHWQRFLHDFDEDGVPELVAANATGVYIYSRDGTAYRESAFLPILPPLRLLQGADQPIWPMAARRVAFPARQMSCRLFFEGNGVSVLTREEAGGGALYQRKTYELDGEAGWAAQPDQPTEATSEVLPPHVRPCRLNDDAVIDYAGGRWQVPDTALLPKLLYETWASLDGGRSFHIRRAPVCNSFRPHCSFVDFDGDGDFDMVTESMGLFEGGVREALNRFLTRKAVDHVVSVYRQARGRFSRAPDLQVRLTIALRQPPVWNGPEFRRYQAAELVNLTGDFNGDGYRDLLVQEYPGRLSVYLAAGFGFPARPDATVEVLERAHAGVSDVNGDGKSDIVLRWVELVEGERVERGKVYFAREDVE